MRPDSDRLIFFDPHEGKFVWLEGKANTVCVCVSTSVRMESDSGIFPSDSG